MAWQENEEKEGDYTLKPAAGRVAIKVLSRSGMTKGGLYIPDSAAPERATVGEVVNVCDKYALDGEEYEHLYPLGTIVVFGKYSGTEVQVGHDRVIVMKENDVLGVLQKNGDQPIDPEAVHVNDRF